MTLGQIIVPLARFREKCQLLVLVRPKRIRTKEQREHACAARQNPPHFLLFFHAAGYCLSRLCRWQSLLDPTAASPYPPFRVLFRRLLLFPPLGAFPSDCLLQPSEYVSRVLSLALVSEYRSIIPILGRTPCELSAFRPRWFASTALPGIPISWFCA
jgi:hypothetical protein